MFDFAPIAAAHGVETEALQSYVKGAGWDFDAVNAAWATFDERGIEFLNNTVSGYAAKMAERAAKLAARQAKVAADCEARKTPAAKAHPEATCYKCDGAGKIYGFSHIENGTCFACGGKGIRAIRKCR